MTANGFESAVFIDVFITKLTVLFVSDLKSLKLFDQSEKYFTPNNGWYNPTRICVAECIVCATIVYTLS